MTTWNQRNRERYNAAWRKWYCANAQRKIEWQLRRRAAMRAWFLELKATKQCERCGERTVQCLQFHHRDPSQKDIEVSKAVLAWSRERILAEIAKCSILCANCHLKLHWEERRRKSRGDRI